MLDTMRDVIAQDFLSTRRNARTRCSDLRDDIDAVAIVLDHARKSANLTFNPFQPFQARCT